jgi:hypothetical protein
MPARSLCFRQSLAWRLVALMSFLAVSVAHAEGDNPAAGFLKTYCLSCHDSAKKRGDVDLGRFSTEASVAGARKIWLDALRIVKNGEMPPVGAKQPTPDERDAFAEAIRGVYRRADAGKPIDPGRVVLRRLNRTEYGNTIRDLCRIEFDSTEALPPDNASHGFDNNAESLSLSPLLVERYLDAAEVVIGRVLAGAKPGDLPVRVGFEQFINTGTKLPYGLLLLTSEPLVAEFRVAAGGDYLLRLDGRPSSKAIDIPETAILVDGKEVRRVTFVVPEKSNVAKLEIPLTLSPGRRRIAVSLMNPVPEQEAKRALLPHLIDGQNKEKYDGLGLHRFDLAGPKDRPTAAYRHIMARDESAEPRVQARQILSRFATRAFRRPASPEEVERYVRVYDQARVAGKDFEPAIGLALQGILISPSFLLRGETQPSTAPGIQPVSEYHLASRLSYFLWSTMPDDELLDLAAKGTLSKNLDSQVRRMLLDGRVAALVENFTPQWLGITGMDRIDRGERFDLMTRRAVVQESILFFDHVLRENRSITDFIDGRYTFVNERLARIYGLGQFSKEKSFAAPAVGFRKVELPADGPRAGILTHASILIATSSPDRTSPVKRGMWILDNVLASPPPPPPANVPPLDDPAKSDKPKTAATLRARLEQHRAAVECAGCHAKIDPFGFALEKFDVMGQYRGGPIDDRAELPGGRSLRGVEGLRSLLLERKDAFARCLAEKMLTYALGRGLDEHDIRTVDTIAAGVASDGYRLHTLVQEVVRSVPFRMQRENPKERP